jgi:hypothetical protein
MLQLYIPSFSHYYIHYPPPEPITEQGMASDEKQKRMFGWVIFRCDVFKFIFRSQTFQGNTIHSNRPQISFLPLQQKMRAQTLRIYSRWALSSSQSASGHACVPPLPSSQGYWSTPSATCSLTRTKNLSKIHEFVRNRILTFIER